MYYNQAKDVKLVLTKDRRGVVKMNFTGNQILKIIIPLLSLVIGVLSFVYHIQYKRRLAGNVLQGEIAKRFKKQFNILGMLYVFIALLVILDAYATMGFMSLIILLIVAGGGGYNLMIINKKDVFDLSDINFLKWNSIILLTITVIYLLSR
jgi:4-hydroxybenzoate polyprenyltransferase